MKPNNESAHKHLTYDEISRFYAIDFEKSPSEDDMNFYNYVDAKAENCNVCHQQMKLYFTIGDLLPSLTVKPQTEKQKITSYLRDFLEQTDQQLRDKLSSWLEGPQSFIGDLNQLRLSPAGAFGSRDLESGEKTLTPELSAEGNIGFFNFELQSTVKLNISIKQKPGDDQPICVVIFGRDKTNFTAAYPLETYGEKHLRAKTDALPAGEYVLCVPAMFTQE
jgi:hypothetical protein